MFELCVKSWIKPLFYTVIWFSETQKERLVTGDLMDTQDSDDTELEVFKRWQGAWTMNVSVAQFLSLLNKHTEIVTFSKGRDNWYTKLLEMKQRFIKHVSLQATF